MKKRIRIFIHLALFLSLLLSVLGLLDGEQLAFDLASHFKLQYALCGVFCLIYFLVSKAYISSGLSVILLVLNGYFLVPFYHGDDTENHAGKSELKILVSNVLSSNTSPEALISLINEESPDVILLMETNQRWVNSMQKINLVYSHSFTEAREDNSGISLFSKTPIENVDIGHFGSDSLPSIVARLSTGNREFSFIGTHPLPPINRRYYESRNSQLRELAQAAKGWGGPLIVAGDLNTTMWSRNYKEFEKEGDLHNTRYGFGVLPSWPSMAATFGIPIDHILISKHFVTTDFRVGPNTGSDHRPIIATLRFRDGVQKIEAKI